MYWFECLNKTANKIFVAVFLTGLTIQSAVAEPGDFVIGAGVETDSQDNLALSLLGDVAVAKKTWLSGSIGYSGVDGPLRQQIDYLYADIGVDHFFDPVGFRFGVSYWGDSDLLDSSDLRGSIYSRSGDSSLSIDGEYRDFEFDIPPTSLRPQINVGFDATGLGLTARIGVGDRVDVRASGMSYEYSREFNLGDDAAAVVDVLTFSRLSVLSSLVDWRAGAGIGVDVGLRRWQIDVSKWRGIVDNSDNFGATISFLTPMTNRTDLEISLGYDDSDLYGDVTFLSAFVYFYGAD